MTDTTAVAPLDFEERINLMGLIAGYRVVCQYDLAECDAFAHTPETALGALRRQSVLDRIALIDETLARLRAINNYEAGV